MPVAATVTVLFRYMNEQIDLRTGDVRAEQLEPITAEGVMTAEDGEGQGRLLAIRSREGHPADARIDGRDRRRGLRDRLRRRNTDTDED